MDKYSNKQFTEQIHHKLYSNTCPDKMKNSRQIHSILMCQDVV